MKSVLHSYEQLVAAVGAIGYNQVFGAIDLCMFSRKDFDDGSQLE